jgi:hypothetical protein
MKHEEKDFWSIGKCWHCGRKAVRREELLSENPIVYYECRICRKGMAFPLIDHTTHKLQTKAK